MESLTRPNTLIHQHSVRDGVADDMLLLSASRISFSNRRPLPFTYSLRSKTILPPPISATSHSQSLASETVVGGKDESSTARVKFLLQKACAFGDRFLMVGDDPMFGSWDPENAIPLEWSDGHVWIVQVDIPIGKAIQFKFILKQSMGNIIWQPGPDRIFKTWSTHKTITVVEDWENSELQKIIEDTDIGEELLMDVGSHKQIQPIDGATDAHTTNSLTENLPNDMLERIVAEDIAGTQVAPLIAVAKNVTFSKDVDFTNQKIIALAAEGGNYRGKESAISMMVADNTVNDHGRCESTEGLEDGAVFLSHHGDPVLVPGMATDESCLANKDKNNAVNGPVRSQDYMEQSAPKVTA
uniref:CBM20 domain-containing protein n=1 Tax=Kalanchoe fedtschenkoi TaxID=63787 RepID=A0A7N0T339_KALFE